MNLSSRLRQYRLEFGYTQEKLAGICGVSRQAVAKWEGGTSVPDVEKLLCLAGLFHVSMEKLLTGNEAGSGSELTGGIRAENEKLVNKGLRRAMACDDPHEEIQVFIEYIGRMMNCDRICIFEQDPRGDYCNSYEWCNRGVAPQIDRLQGVPAADLGTWIETFRRGDFVFIEDLALIKPTDPALYKWLAPQQIESIMAFPLFEGRGFLAVDNPVMAFVRQTVTLMELIDHFVESMLQRRDLVQRLLIETDQTRDTDRPAHRARYYINAQTGSIVINTEVFGELGYPFELHSMEDLYRLLERHPECRGHILEEGLEKARDTKTANTIEFVFYTHDHMIHWARLSIRPFLDSRGNLLQLHGTLQDISNEHQVIERYNAFTTHLRGGMHICYLSEPCHLSYASDNLCELVGYTRREFDELIGEDYSILIEDEDVPTFLGYVQRLGQNPGTVETCEYGLKHKNGTIVRVIDTMESVRDGNGVVYGYANVMDVSELHRMLDVARENEISQLAEIDKQFEIVEALSRDYRNVFLVDLEKEEAFIHKLNGYVTRGMDRQSAAPIPYYDYCRRYIEDRVFSADREMMTKAMHLDTVRRKLREDSEYISSYRILEDGEVRYCQFKYIVPDQESRNSGCPRWIIAAFKSVDTIVRQEKERQKAMRLRMDIINAFLAIYRVGYYVNMEEDTVTELTLGSEDIEPHKNAAAFLMTYGILPCESVEKAIRMLSPKAVQKKLTDRDYICEQCCCGKNTWYELSYVAGLRGEDGKPKQFFIMVRDISAEKERELRQQEALRLSRRRELEMHEAACRDVLTGIMNRTAYQQFLEETDINRELGVVFCDVNNLKITNDTLGHSAGDRLLCRFVDLIKKHFSADSIFRIGGDEFVCAVSGCAEESFLPRAEALADEIRKNDDIAAIGFAYGFGREKEALIRQAEELMYSDKKEKKKRAVNRGT